MPTSEELVAAAMVPRRQGRIYCIGSFASRVNFLAQQRRALNLVWALHEQKKFAQGERVAVIGAGLAGVTAAAAFIAFGAKVDVYETGGRALHLQRETNHRRVHPSINAWPHEPVRVTTELPFFDWYSGLCNEIADGIAKDFERMMDGENHKFIRRHKATDIQPMGTNLVRVVTTPERFDRLNYHLALISIGFGKEVNKTSFRSDTYWRSDNLESDRDELDEAYIVSGCGDGGLIDALRIVHFNFEKGRLAFWVADQLYDTPLAQALRDAEDRFGLDADPGPLKAAYILAAERLEREPGYELVQARLSESLDAFGGLVYLGDLLLESPYVGKSAPIHKLLVAHAERQAKIHFHAGAIQKVSRETLEFANVDFDSPPRTKIVVRHGASPKFGRLMPKKSLAELQDKQSKLSNSYAEQAWPTDFIYPNPTGFPIEDPLSKPFIRSRYAIAQRAMAEIIKAAALLPVVGGFRVDLYEDLPGPVPDTLFRIPVTYQSIKESDTIV